MSFFDLNRTSLFGSFKDKLTRRNSKRDDESSSCATLHSSNNNSFADPQSPPPPVYTAMPGPIIAVQPPSPDNWDQPPAASHASGISITSLAIPEDPYAFLTQFDTVFLIDDSYSMQGSSWREVKDVLRKITPICTSHDADGIDVYFFNCHNPKHPMGGFPNIVSPDQVERLFQQVRPSGGTPTGTRINQILKPYLHTYEKAITRTSDPDNSGIKPVNMIVITDGQANDDPESVIISLAKKLDSLEAPPYQVGIQFFQVGNDRYARQKLMQLDDDLSKIAKGEVRDIVDTVSWEGSGRQNVLTADGILKVVLGAVVKRLDRKELGSCVMELG